MTHSRIFPDGQVRCNWVTLDPLYIDYHDKEWGTKTNGQNAFFEKITLEGFQSGLSWLTILRRRDSFRAAFEDFDVSKVARFSDSKVQELLADPGIIRNRSKILATIQNANIIENEGLDLTGLIWSFSIPAGPIVGEDFEWRTTSPESEALSKHLKNLGFKYVGATTMFALMQSTGIVSDHAPGCFKRP